MREFFGGGDYIKHKESDAFKEIFLYSVMTESFQQLLTLLQDEAFVAYSEKLLKTHDKINNSPKCHLILYSLWQHNTMLPQKLTHESPRLNNRLQIKHIMLLLCYNCVNKQAVKLQKPTNI